MMKIGTRIRWLKICPSTNDLARELAIAGEEEGTVVMAEEQTKGKGTRGRSWYSPQKKGLYASVILRPLKPAISLLPLVAGLAVREAVFESLGIRLRLKWPNDLIWEDKKLGGILCESGFLGNRLSYVILGIGLNINHDIEDFPPEIRPQATSLKLIKGKDIEVNEILLRLWPALNGWYQLFLRGEEKKIVASFEQSSALALGEKIRVITEKGEFEGLFKGIDSFGGLILEERGREKSFFSAQIKIVASQ